MPVNNFTSQNQFYPMANPGYQYNPGYPYGQTQQPYVPTPSYQPMNTSAQNQQSQNRPQGILGRMISNPNEITPQEIPMDGSISMFPMQDGSAVYGKFWDSNGQIKTIRFVPENNGEQPQQNDPFAVINGRLDDLENLIKQRVKPYNKNYRKNNQNGGSESVREEQSNES